MRRRVYTHEDKAAVLVALDWNEGNALRAAKQMDIPVATLRSWVRRGVSSDVITLRDEKKQSLIDKLEDLAHRALDLLLERLQTTSVRQLSARQLVIIAAIAVDKMLMLNSKKDSQDNTHTSVLVDDIAASLSEFTRLHTTTE